MKSKIKFCGIGVMLLLLCTTVGGCSHDSSEQSQQITKESPERLARIRSMAEDWPKEPAYRDSFDPLDPSAKSEDDKEAEEKKAEITTTLLPTAANGAHNLVTGYCSGCHSLDIVTQQHASRRRWKELLVWMEKTQGMPALPADDEAKVIEYLSTNFGAGS